MAKMCSCFVDPAKAKGFFQKFKELRDDGVFSVVEKFLKETSVDSDTMVSLINHPSYSCEFYMNLFGFFNYTIFIS